MPELPEVENVRLSLAARILGRRVAAVALRRADVVTGERSPGALLRGSAVREVRRLGKQLAIVGENGRCVCVHLGMTGSLCYRPAGNGDASNEPEPQKTTAAGRPSHLHVIWTLDDGGRIEFRDPRRFGGLWTFADLETLWRERWSLLGPDALLIRPSDLAAALEKSRRPIKAALLDQAVVAGLGNIYVDELLFRCGVHPVTRADAVPPDRVRQLVTQGRRLLKTAIRAGGSTLRDYVDGEGRSGRFQSLHRVYGRAGRACVTCGGELASMRILGRMTVACPRCQLVGRPKGWPTD